MSESKLKNLSMEFSVDIIELVKYLKSIKESIISNQIGRSGTSIGANIHEAQYVQGKKDNDQCFIGDYYYTGDKARKDENGNFWFLGRSDDIIKSSGYRIGPLEVEEAMMQHDAVHEVAVVGAPDPMRGAKVKAYIVLHEGWEATESLVKELQQHCKRITAPYKYPREIEFVHSLPKTFSGKIKRDILRKYAETGEQSGSDRLETTGELRLRQCYDCMKWGR